MLTEAGINEVSRGYLRCVPRREQDAVMRDIVRVTEWASGMPCAVVRGLFSGRWRVVRLAAEDVPRIADLYRLEKDAEFAAGMRAAEAAEAAGEL